MTTRINPGGPIKRLAPRRPYRPPGLPAGANPGGPVARLAPHAKKAPPAKKTGHAKKARKRSPGVAQCCVAQALADSLEALGRPVDGDAVLDLYWRTARTAGAGASVLATLEAAAEHGLGDWHLASFEEVMPGDAIPATGRVTRAGLILGMDRPGPHAAYDYAPGVVEEAWAVTWA